MQRPYDQYFWNAVIGVLYISLVVYGVVVLDARAYLGFALLDVADIALISLASFRLTRLFVYDHATKFVREFFYDSGYIHGEQVLTKPPRGLRRTLADLFSCPWCFGVWAATGVTFAYLATPYAYVPVVIFSVAGVATLLQLVANLIGHQAENAKQRHELPL